MPDEAQPAAGQPGAIQPGELTSATAAAESVEEWEGESAITNEYIGVYDLEELRD